MGGGILREARIAFSVIAVSEFGRHCERMAKAAQKGEKGLRDGGAGPARSMRQAQREYRPACREFAAMCAGRGLPSSVHSGSMSEPPARAAAGKRRQPP